MDSNILRNLEKYLPDDVPDLVSDSDDEQTQQSDDEPEPTSLTGDPVQRGNRPEAYEFVVFRKDLKWCGVIGSRMFPLRDFQRGLLCKQGVKSKPWLHLRRLKQIMRPRLRRAPSNHSCGIKIVLG